MTDFPTSSPLLSLQHKKKDGIRPPRSRPSVKDLVRSGERGSVTCPALTIGRTNRELFCGLVGVTAGVIERRDAPTSRLEKSGTFAQHLACGQWPVSARSGRTFAS